MPNRRLLLSVPALLALGPAALAQAPATGDFTYRGVSVDDSAAPPARRARLEAYLRQQIDLVQTVRIKPEIAAFFESIPLRIDPALRMPGRFGPGGLTLSDQTSPAENPVLLHELIHAWHSSRSTEAQREAIRAAYAAARASGRFRPDAYMLSNPREFLAMTASVVLWGRAAREPFTRERVKATMPDFYAWLVDAFGLQL